VAGQELAARRWLDSLFTAHLPSATYEHADEEFRTRIVRHLQHVTETANRLLGQYHAIPAAAWERRDTQHPEVAGPSEQDLADLAALFGGAWDLDDDDDTEEDDQ
jgi:uncharacterized protein YecA (UPF0149 family)